MLTQREVIAALKNASDALRVLNDKTKSLSKQIANMDYALFVLNEAAFTRFVETLKSTTDSAQSLSAGFDTISKKLTRRK